VEEARETIINSSKNGAFFEAIDRLSHSSAEDRDSLTANLIDLHNEGKIDLVEEYSKLKNSRESPGNFFLLRHVFEKALPKLSAEIGATMSCVMHLYSEAGNDMAAGLILDAYIEFCRGDPSRPRIALDKIQGNSSLIDLLTPTIVSGAFFDVDYYLSQTLSFIQVDDIGIRRRAIFSLGRIQFPDDFIFPESVYETLGHAIKEENDDEFLGPAVRTFFSLLRYENAQKQRLFQMMENAFAKGGISTLHAGSEILGLFTDEALKITDTDLPELIDLLLKYLANVDPNNARTVEFIDYGITKLLETERSESAIEFVQTFLVENHREATLDQFESVIRKIRENEILRNKVSTRWLLTGKEVLCEGVNKIVGADQGSNFTVDVDPSEIVPLDKTHIIFIARKSIGYLFLNPKSAASLIVSLMKVAPDEETLFELTKHLVDPLLINFNGKPFEYVESRASTENAEIALKLREALDAIRSYLKGIHSAGEISELHPSQMHQEVYNRKIMQQMAESMKEAEARSPILSLATKQTILYGRGSIAYVHHAVGAKERIEVPLQMHSIEIEHPRGDKLDPNGLDFLLRVFRAEQIRQ